MKKSIFFAIVAMLCVFSTQYGNANDGVFLKERGMQMKSARVTFTLLAVDGEGLFGASVHVKGYSGGAISDLNGGVSIDVPSFNSILVITFRDYPPYEIKAGDANGKTIQTRYENYE